MSGLIPLTSPQLGRTHRLHLCAEPEQPEQGADALNASVPESLLWRGSCRTGTFVRPDPPPFRLLLPVPGLYLVINEIFGDNNHASYNSMIIKGTKRFSHGLTFLSTFTWSKNMDESARGVGSNLNGSPQRLRRTLILSRVSTAIRMSTHRWRLQFVRTSFRKGETVPEVHRAEPWGPGLSAVGSSTPFRSFSPASRCKSIRTTPIRNTDMAFSARRPDQRQPRVNACTIYINPAAFTEAPAATFGNTPVLWELVCPTQAELGRFHL